MTGVVTGAHVPRQLIEDIQAQLDLQELTITYGKHFELYACFSKREADDIGIQGMTETSPVSFMTLTTNSLEKKLSTVGSIMPHTSAKIIDAKRANRSQGSPRRAMPFRVSPADRVLEESYSDGRSDEKG
jgi:acyl-CoA synthetase (AMP-forming)/AMP-acid ligase II